MTRLLVALVFWPTLVFAATGDKIGSSISDELADAGVAGLPFSWRPSDGTVRTDDSRLTEVQRQKILAVFAAHNPATPSRTAVKANAKQQAKDALVSQCQIVAASLSASPFEKTLCAALSD